MSMAISCIHGSINDSKKILCNKTGNFCVHVYFCTRRQRWEQTVAAARCPLLEEEEQDGKE